MGWNMTGALVFIPVALGTVVAVVMVMDHLARIKTLETELDRLKQATLPAPRRNA